jgi:hypothetical protein
MLPDIYNPLAGIEEVGAVVTLTPAGAGNAVTIFPKTLQTTSGVIGNKTYKIKSMHIKNTSGSDADVSIGTGLAGLFVAAMPLIHIVDPFDDDIPVDTSPEFSSDITALTSSAPCTIQLKVEEIG